MSQPSGQNPNQPFTGQAMVGQLLTPAEYARLGAEMRSSGMDEVAIGDYFEFVERTVLGVAQQAARDVVMKTLPRTLAMSRNVHRTAALEIMRRIQAKTGGLGVLSHAGCAQICMDVAEQVPSQMTRGPVRAGVLQHRQR